MNIHDIKYKASVMMQENKPMLARVFIMIALISPCASYLGSLLGGIFSLIITIAFLTFTHGYITSSLKAIHAKEGEIDLIEDGFVGFSRFKELFPTYFIYQAFLVIIALIISMIGMFIGTMFLSKDTINQLREFVLVARNYGDIDVVSLINSGIITNNMINAVMQGFWIIMIIVAVIGGFMLFYTLTFALTPYLLERYQLTGTKAMSESSRLMKGYRWTLFKLLFSYIGWMLLSGLIGLMISSFINFSILPTLIMAIAEVLIYRVHYELSKAVFFEERLLDEQEETSSDHLQEETWNEIG